MTHVKLLTRRVTSLITRTQQRMPRHRIAPSTPQPRTHPWFEQRARRAAELGPYR